MPASILVAAPDSALKVRQAADLVVSSSTPHDAQINAAAAAARGTIGLAAGTYQPAAPITRLTGLEWIGEGEDTCVTPHPAWNGAPGIFSTAPAAHYTRIAHLRIDGAGRVASGAYADSGKPDGAAPPTSPDSWHRHDHLVVHGHTGSAFASTSGTDYTREGWIQDCLVIGDFAWAGSDVYIDGLEVRNAKTPVVLGGGNARVGLVKVFYSDAPVAVRVASSRFLGGVVEVQDAGYHGIEIATADCLIGALRIDSSGRSTPNGDALILNAAGAHLPAVQIVNRNSWAGRNGIVATSANGAVVDATIGAGLTGATYTGADLGRMARLAVNGRIVAGAQPGGSVVDLAPLTSRVAALEAAGANVDTSLRAVDASLADLDTRIAAAEQAAAALAVRATDTENRTGAHIEWAKLRDADHAAIAVALAARLDRLEQREQSTAAMLSTLDQAIAAVSTQAPKARDALRVVRGIIATHVGAA